MGSWLNVIGFVSLAVACVGVLSSLSFLILALLGAAKFHRESEQQRRFAEKIARWPAV